MMAADMLGVGLLQDTGQDSTGRRGVIAVALMHKDSTAFTLANHPVCCASLTNHPVCCASRAKRDSMALLMNA